MASKLSRCIDSLSLSLIAMASKLFRSIDSLSLSLPLSRFLLLWLAVELDLIGGDLQYNF